MCFRSALLAAVAAAMAAYASEPATPVPAAPAHHVEGGFRNVPAVPPPDAVAFGFDRLRFAAIPNPGAEARPARQSSAEARAAWDATGDADAVLWIGHATVLVRLGGKTILFDPLFDDYATPVPPVGPRRLAPPGIALAVLPRIDAILVSHDHYDHFEPSTIRCMLAIHWGTFALGTDDAEAARTDVPRAAAAAGVVTDRMWVIEPGEAWRF